jgi:hypothetical protein
MAAHQVHPDHGSPVLALGTVPLADVLGVELDGVELDGVELVGVEEVDELLLAVIVLGFTVV